MRDTDVGCDLNRGNQLRALEHDACVWVRARGRTRMPRVVRLPNFGDNLGARVSHEHYDPIAYLDSMRRLRPWWTKILPISFGFWYCKRYCKSR